MELFVLASGSSGNAAVVRAGGRTVLVDVGVTRIQVVRRMEAMGLDPDTVDAILITHEHSDHVKGLDVFSRRHPAPVWATRGTWSRLNVRCASGGELISGGELRLGDLTITPVATSHDAAEPVAFVFSDQRHRAALCTDTGLFTTLLARRLVDLDAVLMETNHDPDLLRHGPYPWPLKQRIASRHGHLANHQACEALDQIRSSTLKAVLGLHLSAENNCPDMAGEGLRCAVPEASVAEAVTREMMVRLVLNGDSPTLERMAVPPRP
jgi:phosphoribosyl 1,2-cyclic phosphodiesterase